MLREEHGLTRQWRHGNCGLESSAWLGREGRWIEDRNGVLGSVREHVQLGFSATTPAELGNAGGGEDEHGSSVGAHISWPERRWW